MAGAKSEGPCTVYFFYSLFIVQPLVICTLWLRCPHILATNSLLPPAKLVREQTFQILIFANIHVCDYSGPSMIALMTPLPSSLFPALVTSNACFASSNLNLKRRLVTEISTQMTTIPMSNEFFEGDLFLRHQRNGKGIIAGSISRPF